MRPPPRPPITQTLAEKSDTAEKAVLNDAFIRVRRHASSAAFPGQLRKTTKKKKKNYNVFFLFFIIPTAFPRPLKVNGDQIFRVREQNTLSRGEMEVSRRVESKNKF